jgi:hypothetical protein
MKQQLAKLLVLIAGMLWGIALKLRGQKSIQQLKSADLEKASADFLAGVAAFDQSVLSSARTSDRLSGIPSPTNQHYWASLLFTVLCTRCMSLAIMTPRSRWSVKRVDQWDYASVAVLTRSILELRIAFYYLCSEPLPDPEWRTRWNIFNLHDCIHRKQLFIDMESDSEEVKEFDIQADELRTRLQSNPFFLSLPERTRNKLLKGETAYLEPLEDIAVRCGMELSEFRWMYRFLSVHVHSFPMSFYRVGEEDRGRGIHSRVEEGYTLQFVQFATKLLDDSREEIEKLFLGVKKPDG